MVTLICLELYRQIETLLRNSGCDSPSFDAACLLEDIGGIGRGRLAVCAQQPVSKSVFRCVWEAAQRRAAGEPLQYLLGTWDFLNLTLEVGEGVLIPRPETELLCETVAQKLAGISAPCVWDLCAGSGCVGLGIASLCPSATVTALEYSEAALPYLQRNTARYPSLHVTVARADVLHDALSWHGPVDAIVSNPPYIPTAELSSLQREVQHEPALALDGGEDGLRFYRVIATEWAHHLASGGFVAVEVGIGQAQAVRDLFCAAGLIRAEIHPDFSGIDRVVCAYRP